MDDATAELGLLPWQAEKLEPSNLFALVRGRQRAWNRQCLLTAWSTYLVAASMGGFKDMGFQGFINQYPPPGYLPEPEEKKRDPRTTARAASRKR